MRKVFLAFLLCCVAGAQAQQKSLEGTITAREKPVGGATIVLAATPYKTVADSSGYFVLGDVPAGNYKLQVTAAGHLPATKIVTLPAAEPLYIELQPHAQNLDEVVVTGTLKEVRRTESPVPVEVYRPAFFKKNPSPHLFDALQHINGVRPQLNCNVCNTGDIHINGLEGPYTMVLIDGMPIVSALATVYGLCGIPASLIEQVEIVKGPASSLYGSEAVGGLINIITKKPETAPRFTFDTYGTSWKEWNADMGILFKAGATATALTGINYFQYNQPYDKNGDHFTDVTLQQRASVFQKWSFKRKRNRLFSLGGRYYWESRWGGDMRWNAQYKGSDSIYGESIDTRRLEVLGAYQLPVKEKMLLSFSYNQHRQQSYYGNTPFHANQKILFSQLTWDKKLKNHDLLAGAAFRYTYYDDNTPATAKEDSFLVQNHPDKAPLPGLFVQDEMVLGKNHRLLLGLRYDRHPHHGNIFTPRFAYKWTLDEANMLRLNLGTGFRVVNLFTEDHAALTGARRVVLQETLEPEKSININLNYTKKITTGNGSFIGLDASAWYTYFYNRIIADYDTDPNLILYNNLNGHAVTRGISANVDVSLPNGLKILAGGTLMDTYIAEKEEQGNRVKTRPVLTERWTGTWSISYKIRSANLLLDYTGNIYGPMRLPLLGSLDPRREYSPVWSIQNIQLTWAKPESRWEMYGGLKNLLNWTPARNNAFLIARAHDPFDKKVEWDNNGQVIPTTENPYALTFDPNYVYAPNQGIRGFAGIRYTIR